VVVGEAAQPSGVGVQPDAERAGDVGRTGVEDVDTTRRSLSALCKAGAGSGPDDRRLDGVDQGLAAAAGQSSVPHSGRQMRVSHADPAATAAVRVIRMAASPTAAKA
jgi:hypothetical protein